MITVTGLVKRYDGVQGLEGFDLRVQDGEAVGLVGPNGAGKTTLIKILATLLRPDGGQAEIKGYDVAREPRRVRQLVGYLPDVPGLYQDMRIDEFLEFFADAFRLRGPRRRAAVQAALDRSGLADRREEFVEHLSLGLKQRLILAKTLLHEPAVLLLDEPATGLDPLARIELREQLKALTRDGMTILISSHILSDLEEICSRVALIAHGSNAGEGPESRAVAAPEIGATVFTCEVELLGEAEAAVPIASMVPGVRRASGQGRRLRVELRGDAGAPATLLRRLVEAGLPIIRFDPRGPALEERYRRAFGEARR